MTHAQIVNEVNYRRSIQYLNCLLNRGLITQEQYKAIDKLNVASFSPFLKDLYE